MKKHCSRKPWATKTANDGPRKNWKGIRYLLKTERAEKEKTDTPKDNEGKLIPQIGLSKYEQSIGLKRRRGTAVIMVANGEDVCHLEAAYEAIATRKTITAELENSTITLNKAK